MSVDTILFFVLWCPLVAAFDALVVWLCGLVLIQPRFGPWRSVLRSWYWRSLALVLSVIPLVQLAVYNEPDLRFSLEDSVVSMAPIWLKSWARLLVGKIAPLVMFFLPPPLAAVWLRMPPAEATIWPTAKMWTVACLLSALSFAFLIFRDLAERS